MPGMSTKPARRWKKTSGLPISSSKLQQGAGLAAGQFEMGYYHFEGCGNAEQDYALAFDWFEKAYENPKCAADTKAQCAAYLGICYQSGLGVVQDEEVALEFLKEAEEGKDNLWESILGDVLNALGVAYAFGKGTEEDIKLGYQYFEDAARLGSEEAKEFIDYINSSDYDTDKREEADNERPGSPILSSPPRLRC